MTPALSLRNTKSAYIKDYGYTDKIHVNSIQLTLLTWQDNYYLHCQSIHKKIYIYIYFFIYIYVYK
jgi:hypothetical protein